MLSDTVDGWGSIWLILLDSRFSCPPGMYVNKEKTVVETLKKEKKRFRDQKEILS